MTERKPIELEAGWSYMEVGFVGLLDSWPPTALGTMLTLSRLVAAVRYQEAQAALGRRARGAIQTRYVHDALHVRSRALFLVDARTSTDFRIRLCC